MNQRFEIFFTLVARQDTPILLATNLTREEALQHIERDFENGKLTGQVYEKTSMHRWERHTLAHGLHSYVEIVAIKPAQA